jgi:hypothetical protein
MFDSELAKKVQIRADADGLPADHELRTLAAQFDEGVKGYFANPQTITPKAFLGRWARLRKRWCEYSGEPLI